MTTQIDYTLAYRAYIHNSFYPDERAKECQREFTETITRIKEDLYALCTNEEQKTILEKEMHKFEAGYKEKFEAVLRAWGNVASSLVTGSANFPIERNKKALATAKRREERLDTYRSNSVAAMKKKIMDVKTTQEYEKEPEVIARGTGYEIVIDYADDRVKIVFSEKPYEAMRKELKRSGWKYAPSTKAWQRKLTDNAINSATRIMKNTDYAPISL
jgi:hypothetical protein